MKPSIYFGTILLEKNRWATHPRKPSYQVSDWIPRFKDDGFAGIELWENHALLADEQELSKLEKSLLPIEIFNSYVEFDDGYLKARQQVARLVKQLGCKAIKYNFGRERDKLSEYMDNLRDMAAMLPDNCVLLCECHANTVMEAPEIAAKVFADLDDPRYQAILHGFSRTESLERWLRLIGDRVSHIHVALRSTDNVHCKLDADPEFVRSCLDTLGHFGFAGTYTLEFTAGTGTAEENMEALYQSALDDLRFLSDHLR